MRVGPAERLAILRATLAGDEEYAGRDLDCEATVIAQQMCLMWILNYAAQHGDIRLVIRYGMYARLIYLESGAFCRMLFEPTDREVKPDGR